jgi:hypothetical protein
LISKDEARRIAENIAELPDLLAENKLRVVRYGSSGRPLSFYRILSRGHSYTGAGTLIQSYRLLCRDRALDGVSRFQVEHRLLWRGMHAWSASREEVEPRGRFVPKRAPKIANRPVAG